MDEQAAAKVARKIVNDEKTLHLNTIMDNPTRPLSIMASFFVSDKFSVLESDGSPIITLFNAFRSYKNYIANGIISVTFEDSSAPRPSSGSRFTFFGTLQEIEGFKELDDSFQKTHDDARKWIPADPENLKPRYFKFNIKEILYFGPAGAYAGNINPKYYAAAASSVAPPNN